LRVPRAASVLEVAAGTGILTRPLLEVLPEDARLVVTDLNEPMLDYAKQKIATDARLDWRQADGSALPFPDHMFDALVCQYGLMFFPDKVRALGEARRVLKPYGTLLFNVWGSLADNPIARLAHEVIGPLYGRNENFVLVVA